MTAHQAVVLLVVLGFAFYEELREFFVTGSIADGIEAHNHDLVCLAFFNPTLTTPDSAQTHILCQLRY